MSSRSASVRPKAVVESSHRRKRGMVLPFEPHSLTFDGITYSVDMPQVIDFHENTVEIGLEKHFKTESLLISTCRK